MKKLSEIYADVLVIHSDIDEASTISGLEDVLNATFSNIFQKVYGDPLTQALKYIRAVEYQAKQAGYKLPDGWRVTKVAIIELVEEKAKEEA